MMIDILMYGTVFVLQALAQFLKKDIFQKTVAPTFWGICKLKFIVSFFDVCINGNVV